MRKIKTLKNYEKTIFGIKHRLYSIVCNSNTKRYSYYLNEPWTKNVGDILVYKSKRKSKLLNKYTLPLLSTIYTFYFYLIKMPITLIAMPFWMYFDGARNFIRDRAWVNNVRFFNWSNIVIVILLLLAVIFK